ncbi:MAG: two-component system response regulator [Gallionellaceae bacterium]
MNTFVKMQKATILVVDDTPANLSMMNALLKDDYVVKVANSGTRALQIAHADGPPDLILLDIMMPEMDGYEVCRQLKLDVQTRDIPVIFLTAKSEVDDEQHGLELGAVDYITKPISPPIVMARVRNHLALKAAADFLRDQNDYLEQEVKKRTCEVIAIQEATIQIVTSLAETRDASTGNHIRRTQFYIQALAEKLAQSPRFAADLGPHEIESIIKSAPLHDIGKVGIPDNILLKPGRLTPEEFEIMKTHTTLGRDAIENAEAQMGTKIDFLHTAKNTSFSHHEKWDGSGYPQGISGEAIPLSARLMAVADVYDALLNERVYKPAIAHEAALAIMREGRGRHFQPEILDAFLEIHETIRAIATRFADKKDARA